ncbi:hypothetical protein THAOC_05348, partial [Thalassiosira oceanica]
MLFLPQFTCEYYDAEDVSFEDMVDDSDSETEDETDGGATAADDGARQSQADREAQAEAGLGRPRRISRGIRLAPHPAGIVWAPGGRGSPPDGEVHRRRGGRRLRRQAEAGQAVVVRRRRVRLQVRGGVHAKVRPEPHRGPPAPPSLVLRPALRAGGRVQPPGVAVDGRRGRGRRAQRVLPLLQPPQHGHIVRPGGTDELRRKVRARHTRQAGRAERAGAVRAARLRAVGRSHPVREQKGRAGRGVHRGLPARLQRLPPPPGEDKQREGPERALQGIRQAAPQLVREPELAPPDVAGQPRLPAGGADPAVEDARREPPLPRLHPHEVRRMRARRADMLPDVHGQTGRGADRAHTHMHVHPPQALGGAELRRQPQPAVPDEAAVRPAPLLGEPRRPRQHHSAQAYGQRVLPPRAALLVLPHGRLQHQPVLALDEPRRERQAREPLRAILESQVPVLRREGPQAPGADPRGFQQRHPVPVQRQPAPRVRHRQEEGLVRAAREPDPAQGHLPVQQGVPGVRGRRVRRRRRGARGGHVGQGRRRGGRAGRIARRGQGRARGRGRRRHGR